MSEQTNDCPYHVRLHPDEKCTCPRKSQPTTDEQPVEGCNVDVHDLAAYLANCAMFADFTQEPHQERNAVTLRRWLDAVLSLQSDIESVRSILKARDGETLKEAAERVMRILGPLLPQCSKYAVEHSRYEAVDGEVLSIYCGYDNVSVTHEATPEYKAWYAQQEAGS